MPYVKALLFSIAFNISNFHLSLHAQKIIIVLKTIDIPILFTCNMAISVVFTRPLTTFCTKGSSLC